MNMAENESNRTSEMHLEQAKTNSRLTSVMQYLTTCEYVDRVAIVHDSYSIIFVDGTSTEQRKEILDYCDSILKGETTKNE